jgi:hypothetical protein
MRRRPAGRQPHDLVSVLQQHRPHHTVPAGGADHFPEQLALVVVGLLAQEFGSSVMRDEHGFKAKNVFINIASTVHSA